MKGENFYGQKNFQKISNYIITYYYHDFIVCFIMQQVVNQMRSEK